MTSIVEDFKEPYGQKIEVVEAIYLGNHCIGILFDDGMKQSVNFKPFLERSSHPSIKKYLDEALLKKFSITNGNLNWDDYDLIFPVNDLYTGVIK